MRLITVALASLLVAAVPHAAPTQSSRGQLGTAPRPLMPFVDWGACPFEGCQYDVDWTALKEVTAIDEPPFPWAPWNGKPGDPVFTIKPAERVLAMDGVVFFLSPGRARIDRAMEVGIRNPNFPSLHRTIELVPGDIVYLFTYHGEGETTAWFKNELIYFDLIGFEGFGTCSGCIHEGTILERGRSEWWVKVRNSKGEIGWIDGTADFSGKGRSG